MPKRYGKKKRKQLAGLALMMAASERLGLYDAEMVGVPLRTLLTDHGSDAYKKLVRERKTVRQLQRQILSKREQLKAAVQVGLDDSAASRYSEFGSKEALSKHLRMLSKKE
jgi:hypothetical protein